MAPKINAPRDPELAFVAPFPRPSPTGEGRPRRGSSDRHRPHHRTPTFDSGADPGHASPASPVAGKNCTRQVLVPPTAGNGRPPAPGAPSTRSRRARVRIGIRRKSAGAIPPPRPARPRFCRFPVILPTSAASRRGSNCGPHLPQPTLNRAVNSPAERLRPLWPAAARAAAQAGEAAIPDSLSSSTPQAQPRKSALGRGPPSQAQSGLLPGLPSESGGAKGPASIRQPSPGQRRARSGCIPRPTT